MAERGGAAEGLTGTQVLCGDATHRVAVSGRANEATNGRRRKPGFQARQANGGSSHACRRRAGATATGQPAVAIWRRSSDELTTWKMA